MTLPGRPSLSATNWRDAAMADSLQLAAESLCVFGGFSAAAISVVRDGQVVTIAVAGADRVLEADGSPLDVSQILGRSSPLDLLEERLLPFADDWGGVHFLPHGRADVEQIGWRVDRSYDGSEWHPDDMLLVPVRDESGRIRGVISLDGPVDGRVPPVEQRPALLHYAAQAARILLTAVEREELAERVRLLETARQALTDAGAGTSPQDALSEARASLVSAFGLVGLRANVFADQDRAVAAAPDELRRELVRIERESCQELWRNRQVAVMGRDQDVNAHSTPADRETVRLFLHTHDLESVLLVPLGAGPECLGSLALFRCTGARRWTAEECRVAQEIGRDLGRVIANQNALHKEQELVHQLRQLDAYKRELIATVSHELRTPIAGILSNAELISDDDLQGDVRRGVQAMARGARRMNLLVDELLLLARLDDPGRPLDAQPVDLVLLVQEAVDLHRQLAAQRGIELETSYAGEAVARGDLSELAKVAGNLVSNAVKYSQPGGTVRIEVAADVDRVVLAVTDEGIGITDHDRPRLFGEFQRGSDPAVLARPGSGLGLSIVDRVVRRHGGRIEVDSAAGHGSTFRVTLPAS